jgi:hypothetical protein
MPVALHRPLFVAALVLALVPPAQAQPETWRIDHVADGRLTLRGATTAEACPDWAQGLSGFGAPRVATDRAVGTERLIVVAYDAAGIEAECLGGLALLRGPEATLRGAGLAIVD